MIPILYEPSEKQFLTNGIGRLADAVSCVVTEERNGKYELEMEYPVTGRHYSEIKEGTIISAVPSDGKDRQPFVVYEISKPLNGVVTVYAEHISYLLTKSVAMPFKATTAADAMAGMKVNAVTQIPFEFWTDSTANGDFENTEPTSVRSLLGGMAGSVLDVYGGEYEWDKYTVKLHNHRGQDNGVTIRYGKNLTDLKSTTSNAKAFTGIAPFARYTTELGEERVVTLTEKVLWGEHRDEFPYDMAVPMDFSDRFESDTPTEEALRKIATEYLSRSQEWEIDTSLKVSFVALWQTDEYKNIAPLQRVRLCDTVTVVHPELGVDAKLKVVKTEYDVLQERYDSIELGTPQVNFASKVASGIDDLRAEVNVKTNQLEQYINEATTLITGGLGGSVIIVRDANGKPVEICIADTDDLNTAQNVWRWNKNGLGFSSTGYSGTFGTAITVDGRIVADFITAGKMSANIIQGGTLSLGGVDNVNGVLRIYDENGNEIGSWTKDGIVINKGELIGTTIRFIDGESYINNNDVRSKNLRVYSNSGHVGSWTADQQVQHRLWSGAPIKVGTEWGENPSILASGCESPYYNNTSDRRQKKQIEELSAERAKSFIMALKPVRYQYKEYDIGRVHHGMIAQDVQKAMQDDWDVVRQDSEGMLSLNYIEIIADLIKTVQGIEEEIQTLASEVDQLKKGAESATEN